VLFSKFDLGTSDHESYELLLGYITLISYKLYFVFTFNEKANVGIYLI
jgi:hypothetical protein